ncbi:MAG: DUF4242 domain-containing protein [Cyanobacteria bacterium P01_D01_bin.44]
MTFVVVETQSETLLYPENPSEADLRTQDCIAERSGKWLYSLLSGDRHRMICIVEAPDTESVRESFRRGGTVFSHMWSGELIMPEEPPLAHNEPVLKVFEHTYPQGLTWDQWDEANRRVLPCHDKRGVEWVRSYISSDRTRIICELTAPDAEVIRETYRRFNIPYDRGWSALVIKP